MVAQRPTCPIVAGEQKQPLFRSGKTKTSFINISNKYRNINAQNLMRCHSVKKRLSGFLQTFLQAPGAGAIAARPRFGTVFMAAIAPRVGVLNPEKVEVFLPVRAFLLQGRCAIADFHPCGSSVFQQTGLFHIVEIFVAGDRPAAQSALSDGFQKGLFLSAFDPSLNEIAHGLRYARHGRNRGAVFSPVYSRIRLPGRAGFSSDHAELLAAQLQHPADRSLGLDADGFRDGYLGFKVVEAIAKFLERVEFHVAAIIACTEIGGSGDE